jgi:RNA polymerase sigma-70 factor (ECF subfamily)
VSQGEPSPASDETLLAAFNDGDASAFEVLLERYRRPVFNFLLRSTRDRDRAQDLTQETFLRVVQSAGSFQHQSRFSTWLYTIARNLCVDAGRKHALRRHPSLDAPVAGPAFAGGGAAPLLGERVAAPDLGAERRAESKRVGARISAAVEALPPEQREVFLLRHLQHMPFKDIAAVVGVPENTVKSRMRYALERLQAALAEHEDYARELT